MYLPTDLKDETHNTKRLKGIITQICAFSSTVIHPNNDNIEAPTLTSFSDLTSIPNIAQIYTKDWHTNRQNTHLFFILRIQLNDTSLHKLLLYLIPCMRTNAAWMERTILNSGHACVIGWIYKSHVQHTNRANMTKSIQAACNISHPFQLVKRRIYTHSHNTSTFSLGVECAIDHARTIKKELIVRFTKSHNGTPFHPIAPIAFIPNVRSVELDPKTCDRYVESQKQFHYNTRLLSVRNGIAAVEQIIPTNDDETTTISKTIQNDIPEIISMTEGTKKYLEIMIPRQQWGNTLRKLQQINNTMKTQNSDATPIDLTNHHIPDLEVENYKSNTNNT